MADNFGISFLIGASIGASLAQAFSSVNERLRDTQRNLASTRTTATQLQNALTLDSQRNSLINQMRTQGSTPELRQELNRLNLAYRQAMQATSEYRRENESLADSHARAVAEMERTGASVARQIGLNENMLVEALELNLPVAVPTEKAIMRLFQNENTKHLEQDAKFSVDELSQNEINTLLQDVDPEQVETLMQIQEFIDSDLARPDIEMQASLAILDDIGEQARIQLEQAGYTETQAREQARILASNAQRFAPLENAEPKAWLDEKLKIQSAETYTPVNNSLFQDTQGETYGLNTGVDPDTEIEIFNASSLNGDIWNYTKGQARKDILNNIKGVIKNNYTGLDYELNKQGAEHLLSSATKSLKGAGLAHIAAVQNIKQLFEKAIPIETHGDRKNQSDIENIHRFISPMQYKNDTYAVKITVKEYNGTRRIELEGVQKIYDLKLENKKPVEILGLQPYENNAGGYTSQQGKAKVRDLLKGVKSSKDIPYFQSQDPQNKPRGMIQFDQENGKSLITVFQDRKNLSTVLHETSHFFLENLRTAYRKENAPDWVKNSFETLAKELDFNPNMPISIEAQESFARLGEAYFREGKAPSKELQGAFNQFKAWLTAVYRNISKLLRAEELNNEVRSVFDSLLASQEQIAEAKSNFEKSSVMKEAQSIFNIPQEQLNAYQEAVEKGKARADAIIDLKRRNELKDVTKVAILDAKEEIASNPKYQNLENIRNNGKISFENLLNMVEEETAWKLRQKWNENKGYKDLFAENGKGLSLDEAGALSNLRYDELLLDLLQTPSEFEFTSSLVNERKQEYDNNFNADIEFLSDITDEALNIEIEALGGNKLNSKQLADVINTKVGRMKNSEINQNYKVFLNSLKYTFNQEHSYFHIFLSFL